MESFKHRTPIQIRFKDIDKLGHVNNANHLTYFEYARTIYFKDVMGTDIDWAKEGLILAKAVVDYRQPILFEDDIYVYTRCSRIGNKSFDLSYSLVKTEEEKETELASGVSVLVCYDYINKTSIPVPQKWVSMMKAYDHITG
jgi:acyl-CoA thioester hydrolase